MFISIFTSFTCILAAKNSTKGKPASLKRDKVHKYGYVNFVKHENSYLNVSALMSGFIRQPGECALVFADLPNAFSFNFAVNPDEYGRHACDILSTDKYNDSSKFLTNKTGFAHYSIKVSL